METPGRRTVLAPFFRASVAIGAPERQLFSRGLPVADLEDRLRRSDVIFRQNLRRLFGAALLAGTLGGPLVLVEGWRSNPVRRPGRNPRFVTGSWIFACLLRLLRRRGLVPRSVSAIRREVSRCTWEEARALDAVAATLPGGPCVIGVSDRPCPSAARAARYLREGHVLTPAEAVARASIPLSDAQRGFWSAVQPHRSEVLRAPLVEAPNWVIHATSELLRAVAGSDPPLEVRVARALRQDCE